MKWRRWQDGQTRRGYRATGAYLDWTVKRINQYRWELWSTAPLTGDTLHGVYPLASHGKETARCLDEQDIARGGRTTRAAVQLELSL